MSCACSFQADNIILLHDEQPHAEYLPTKVNCDFISMPPSAKHHKLCTSCFMASVYTAALHLRISGMGKRLDAWHNDCIMASHNVQCSPYSVTLAYV